MCGMSMTYRPNFSASDRRKFLADVPSLSPRRVGIFRGPTATRHRRDQIHTYCVLDLLFRLFFLYPPPSAPCFRSVTVDIYFDTIYGTHSVVSYLDLDLAG
jgi:hypothetical protein